jgi:hypothetical protein
VERGRAHQGEGAGYGEIDVGSPWRWVDERAEKGVGTVAIAGGERPPVAIDG